MILYNSSRWRVEAGVRAARLKQIQVMGTRRYVLSVDNDNDFQVTM